MAFKREKMDKFHAHTEKYGGTGISWNCGSRLASAARLEVVVKAFKGRI